MPAYKDKEKGTWYASFYYEDWTGKKVKKMKRGFPTKREALEWERTFLQQQTADLEMTFENFVAVYVADMKGRIKENTWGTKEHTGISETGVSGPGFQGRHQRGHGVEPVGALGEGTTLRRDGAPRDRVGG